MASAALAAAFLVVAAALSLVHAGPFERTLGDLRVEFTEADAPARRAVVTAIRTGGVQYNGEMQVPLEQQLEAHQAALPAESGAADDIANHLVGAYIRVAGSEFRHDELWDDDIDAAWRGAIPRDANGAPDRARYGGRAQRSGLCALDSLAMAMAQARGGEVADDAVDQLADQLYFDMVLARVPNEEGWAPRAAIIRQRGTNAYTPGYTAATTVEAAMHPWA